MFDYKTKSKEYFDQFTKRLIKTSFISLVHSTAQTQTIPIHIFYHYVWRFENQHIQFLPIYVPFDKHPILTYTDTVYALCDNQTLRFVYDLNDLVLNDSDLYFFYDVVYVIMRDK